MSILNLMLQSGHEPAAEANAEEMNEQNEAPDPISCLSARDQTNEELWSHQQLDGKYIPSET